jgi:hypothetical protein
MNKTRTIVAALAAVTLLSCGSTAALSQAAQPATPPGAKSAPPAATMPAPAASDKTSQPRSAVSIECSKEADAKGLHGKARREFRSECRKNAMGKPS